jgi:hypothetical protein
MHGHEFEVRLFHSGATSCAADLAGPLVSPGILHLPLVERFFLDGYLLKPAAKLLNVLAVPGPVIIRVALHNVKGLKALDRTGTWVGHENLPPIGLERNDVIFDEESSATELQFNREAVVHRLMDRLASAFGMRPNYPRA